MIFSAGLSPVWQQILEFDSLQVGEVNRARSAHWCASGKVLNVAIAAKGLGEKTSLLSMIGGLNGEAIAAELAAQEILTDWLHVETPTRVCTTILDQSGVTTELVENVSDVENAVLDEFVDRFRIHSQVAEVTVLTGSIPANAPEDYYARLIRNVPSRFLLDIRGDGLLQTLPFCPFLIKPNREELEATVQSSLPDEASVVQAMQSLNRMGAQWVVVSNGPESTLVTSLDGTWRLQPPQVDLVNPIGCGDSLAAGIAVGVSRGDEVLDAVRLGMGAAAQNAQSLFPARVTLEVTEEFAQKVQIESIGES
ncbi:1-phosphofructokinase family hexose kinase [Thalassoglobus sp.]|uniref:1-phosphofructokinase family hexose kinase n=1 Tax=Thalassoglobus sp. TaxID=2795869 RepID=UPI003AA97A24